MNKQETDRGFVYYEFQDRGGSKCSLQESSSSEPSIWFGPQDPNPQVLSENGWVPYPIPRDVMVNTRMHLTQKQVQQLLPLLHKFAETGSL